jgi:hypothetical protein
MNHEPCESGSAFVPEASAHRVLEKGVPSEWSSLFNYPDSGFVEFSGAEVDIQGESKRVVTLTGITFKTKKLGKRPSGIDLTGQCGGGITGHIIVADLDSTPPRIIAAESDLPDRTSPIKFPWTVSLTDPLLLYVNATTKRCFCEWYAEIPWVSGSQRGVIMIGNPGKGFRVASGRGLRIYVPEQNGWTSLAG